MIFKERNAVGLSADRVFWLVISKYRQLISGLKEN